MSDPRIEAGLDVLSTISGSSEGGEALAEFFASRGALGSIVHLTGAGEIWAREQFSRRDRSMVVISALTAMGREVELRDSLVKTSRELEIAEPVSSRTTSHVPSLPTSHVPALPPPAAPLPAPRRRRRRSGI